MRSDKRRTMKSPAKLIVLCCLVLAAASFAAIAGAASATRPKPWQWTPEKVVKRLMAATPILASDIGSNVLSARCGGLGRGVAGRFSGFTCQTVWGDSNGNYSSILNIRILPIGSGKFCVVTTTDHGELVSVPHQTGTGGTRIKPERACP